MKGRQMRRDGWLAILAAGLIVLVAADRLQGQEDAESEAVAPGAWAWTGVVPEEGEAPAPLPGAEVRGAEALLEELARIELTLRVDRGFAAAGERLDGLWMAASLAAGYPGQMDVMVSIAAARAELLLDLGRTAEALGALEHLWLDLDELGWEPGPELFVPATDAQLEAEAEALRTPRLASLRAGAEEAARLDQADPDRAEDAAADPLLERIREGLRVGSERIVQRDLGTAAIPDLERLLREDLGSYAHDYRMDPLWHLVKLAEVQAARTILELFDQGGYFWHRRIIRAMREARILRNSGSWEYVNERTPPLCREPQWLDVLELLIRDPESTRDCWSMVNDVAERDALTPGLQQALIEALGRGDADLVNQCLQALDLCWGTESSRPVLEVMLHHPHPPARAFAAARLASHPDIGALRGCAQHPDPEVRRWLAEALAKLGPGYQVRYGQDSRAIKQSIGLSREVRSGDAHLLRLLLRDSDPAVFRAAVATAVEHGLGATLGLHDFLAIARKDDELARENLADLKHPDRSVMKEVMTLLARDSSEAVISAVDLRLSNVNWEADADTWLPIFMERWGHAGHPLYEAVNSRVEKWILEHALRHPDAAAVLVPWALERDDDRLIRAFYEPGGGRALGHWAHLEPDVLAPAMLKLASLDREATLVLSGLLQQAMPGPADALLSVACDAAAPLHVRLEAFWALTPGLAPGAGPTPAGVPIEGPFREALDQCLRDPGLGDPYQQGYTDPLRRLWRGMPEALSDPMLLEILRDRGIGDRLAYYVAKVHREHYASELYEWHQIGAILDRWYGPGREFSRVVRKALGDLGSYPEQAPRELLIEAVRVPDYTEVAIESMARIHDPAFVDSLGACLHSPDWIEGEADRTEVQTAAVEALATYLSDEAAAHLLAGLEIPTCEAVRESCLGGLQEIRRYQEEKERWEARFTGAEARERGVARLMAMLEDGDEAIRVEAVRALGTFGAVEAMPRLIELLRSDSEALRGAVREALDRLNRPDDGGE